MKFGSGWPEDEMRKREVIFGQPLSFFVVKPFKKHSVLARGYKWDKPGMRPLRMQAARGEGVLPVLRALDDTTDETPG